MLGYEHQSSQGRHDFLGNSFINTLRAHGRYIFDETQKVRSILVHCFVSDYYSRGLFELLFRYYSSDIERDINRNDGENMSALLNTLAKSSEDDKAISNILGSGSRAYMLKKDTLKAISAEPSNSGLRLRRLIRLIDKAFWNKSKPKNPTSRLTKRFKEWVAESESFILESQRLRQGEIRNRGKKHFKSPYLFADIAEESFEIKLPSQIVPEDKCDGLKWVIHTALREFEVPCETYRAVTGCKTEDYSAAIERSELFEEMRFSLVQEDETVKSFPKLMPDCVRFFDSEGDFASRLFKIPMTAYTKRGCEICSDVLLDRIPTGDIERWDFEFENGDVVILPDGRGLIVGERYEDGLSLRGCVKDAYFSDGENNSVRIYSQIPSLMLVIGEEKIAGTAIEINSIRRKLSEFCPDSFERGDSKGERAVVVHIDGFSECKNNSLNTVLVDIPGASKPKSFDFVLINGFSYEFIDAPYVFTSAAAITFPDGIRVSTPSGGGNKLGDENGFSFPLDGEHEYFEILVNDSIAVDIRIPVFLWSDNGEDWRTEPAGDLWKTDFFDMRKLYVKFPDENICFLPEDDDDDDDNEHCVAAEKHGGLLVADMTRFKSWITRDKIKHKVNVRIGRNECPFASVYAASYVSEVNFSADYENGLIDLDCSVTGNSEYFVDILHVGSGEKIADKVAFEDGHLTVSAKLCNGKYSITVFESEDDESGFGTDYIPIKKFEKTLLNKNDFSGQSIRLLGWRRSLNTGRYREFSRDYVIAELDKTDKNTYAGLLRESETDGGKSVSVRFIEGRPNDFRLFLIDEEYGDYMEFLYDTKERTLVEEEAEGLTGGQKYTRYIVLYEDECVFRGSLGDENGNLEEG